MNIYEDITERFVDELMENLTNQEKCGYVLAYASAITDRNFRDFYKLSQIERIKKIRQDQKEFLESNM